MKYKICYSQLIVGKHYKTGEEIEFEDGTDRNYISRLLAIKAIEIKKGSIKQATGNEKKEQKENDNKLDTKETNDTAITSKK